MSLLANHGLIGVKQYGNITLQQIYADPADTNSNIANPTLIPTADLSGALLGDLILLHVRNRKDSGPENSSFGINSGAQGGQTWTSIFLNSANFVANQWFTATFNGTWSTVNIEVVVNNDNPAPAPRMTVLLYIIRPTDPRNIWVVDNAPTNLITVPVGGSNTCEITGITCAQSSFAIAYWLSGAPATYTNLVGTGWSVLGTAQYRNLVSQSNSYAIKFMDSAGTTGNVSKDQNNNGAYLQGILSIKEV